MKQLHYFKNTLILHCEERGAPCRQRIKLAKMAKNKVVLIFYILGLGINQMVGQMLMLDFPILTQAKGHILISIIIKSYINPSQLPHESKHAEPKWDMYKLSTLCDIFLIIKYNVLLEKKITVFMMIAKYLKIQTIR